MAPQMPTSFSILIHPDSMKGIHRGSTPPVGQRVRDSFLNYRKDCLTVFNALRQDNCTKRARHKVWLNGVLKGE